MHAYCCIATLQAMDIPNSSIIFVEPFPINEERPVINIFNNAKIYDTVHDLLTKSGIKMYVSYYFHYWELHEHKNSVKQVIFNSRQGMVSVPCDAVFFYGNFDVNYATFTGEYCSRSYTNQPAIEIHEIILFYSS